MANPARRRGVFTPEQLRALGVDVDALEARDPPPQGRASRRRIHHPGVMNKTERRYAAHLQVLKDCDRIADFAFEPIKLRLGVNWKTAYHPDFLVVRTDGVMELHEVKGHWEDDARVKIKVAAMLHPFVFIAVRVVKGGWERELIRPREEE